MIARIAIVAALVLLPGACGTNPPKLYCTNDRDCASDEVCYIDGCGNPGENLAVEVVPQEGSGEAQDFAIEPGGLKAHQVFSLAPPSAIAGTVNRVTDAGIEVYSQRMAVTVRGESTVIPGLRRRYDAVALAETGVFALHVGAGLYSLTARAEDYLVPPLVYRGLEITAGTTLQTDLLLPGSELLVVISGQIARTADGDPVQVPLEIRALDVGTREVLSQRTPVSSTGEFFLIAAPPSGAAEILLEVAPQDPAAMVPRKTFAVPAISATLDQLLLMGDYGAPVTVSGLLRDARGDPVVGARVSISGEVTGGGIFQSATVVSGLDGRFSLLTLAGAPEVPMSLSVHPPPQALPGLTVVPVTVPYSGGSLGEIVCRSRVAVQGAFLLPGGEPAAGVRLVVEPIEGVDGLPAPGDLIETRTDAKGKVELLLDPAHYRLDVFPGENLPRLSRYAIVSEQPGGDVLELPAFTVSSGRTVTGVVQIRQSLEPGSEAVIAPNATVRFFRVADAEGPAGATVLAETVSNASGEFEVVLPTR